MSTRATAPCKSRLCPHCKSTILESSSICPACHHHLRFDPKAVTEKRAQSTFSALRVQGSFRHPPGGDGWEYSVVVAIKNDRGEEIARHVIGVGGLQPNEGRNVTLSVDVFAPGGIPPALPNK